MTTTRDGSGPVPVARWEDVEVLHIAPEYQRDRVNEERVKQIVKGFRWPLFGRLVVAQRDGKLWVVDGWHRLEAARIMGIPKVPIDQYENLDLAEQALLFYSLNSWVNTPHTVEKFRALLLAGDPTAMSVSALLDSVGLKVGKSNGADTVRFPDHLLTAVRKSPHRAHEAICLARALADGQQITQRLFSGCFYLAEHDLAAQVARRVPSMVARGGQPKILKEVNRIMAEYGYKYGGWRVCALAVIAVANNKCQHRIALPENGS